MTIELTKIETKILNGLTDSKRIFFDTYFGKISARKWVSNLKHYDETYSINEVLVICDSFNWEK